jgi:hypothetical protein
LPEVSRGVVPVELISEPSSKPVVVAPNGYRVEGLSVAEVIELLRELS